MGKMADRLRLNQQDKQRKHPEYGLPIATQVFHDEKVSRTRNSYLGAELERSAEAAGKEYSRNYRPRLEEWEVSNPYGKHKFIIVDHPQLGEVALCFPGYLVHADMAQRIFPGCAVVSAGFYTIFCRDDIKTNGKSESLGVPSRQDAVGKKKDEDLIALSLGLV